MPFVIGFLALILVAIIVFIIYNQKKYQSNNKTITEYSSFAEKFNQKLESLKSDNNFISDEEKTKIKEEFAQHYEDCKSLKANNSSSLKDKLESIQKFIDTYPSLDREIAEINENYFRSKIAENQDVFGNVNGRRLDFEQSCAILANEKNVLVAAGAGSGKTLTIVGKVLYLCKKENVNPEDILLVAFERTAADEMSERIAIEIGDSLKATTFHKLGLDIITDAKKNKPNIAKEGTLHKYISDFLVSKSQEPEYVETLVKYFSYYLEMPDNMEEFETLGEKYEYNRGRDYETIKSRYDRNERLKEIKNNPNKMTIEPEQVKNFEELQIANFLFLHGIKYEYEKEYPHKDEKKKYKSYHPDFYLPEYDLWLEHFGITEDGHIPQLSPIEEQKYLEEIEWKRGMHKKNNTKLLETYSYFSKDGELLNRLKDLLIANGVEMKDVDLKDVFNSAYRASGDSYFYEFIKLCETFIHLFKSNDFSIEEMDTMDYPDSKYHKKFAEERKELFIKIIKPIIKGYNKKLKSKNMIDFDDMINGATKLLNSNEYQIHKYSHIIIDEYQDISTSRYNLIKAIIKQTNAGLFAVGDDFQSIFRFTGSDISFFERFDEYFPGSRLVKITNTYRNSQNLIRAAGKFIMKNPNQIKKNLQSNKILSKPISFRFYNDNPFVILKRTLTSIINTYGENKNILFLGRTNYDLQLLRDSNLFEFHPAGGFRYIANPKVPMGFLTAHASKGMEADNVVILNFDNKTLGFPNKISDDPILSLVLNTSDTFRYSEERRLFYVALTRTRNRVYVLTNKSNPSEFYSEFASDPDTETIDDTNRAVVTVHCPRCRTGRMVIRKNESTNKYFVGCSNYPECTYTAKNLSILENPRICPDCGGFLVERHNNKDILYGCTNYPTCRHAERLRCPECGNILVVTTNKDGKQEVGCYNYPECQYTRPFEK